MRALERASLAVLAAALLVAPRLGLALCADGTTFPAGGFVIGQAPVPIAANWTPNVFTATLGSLFVPDTSVFEHNDPTQPLTGGGHDWVLDQGSTLCKVGDVGPAGAAATSWFLPPVSASDCVILPLVVNGAVVSIGFIPQRSDVVTPTCDPTKLSAPGLPNPANTYANQLGCSISHGVATTPQTATTYLFTTSSLNPGIAGQLFSVALQNVANPVVGGSAGKAPGPQRFYSTIPDGQKLTSAAVSRDGQFVIATSSAKLNPIYACLNPLGDPGDPSQPINPAFTVPPASAVPCMQVGNNNLQVDEADAFGPDGQPYFAGQPGVNTFGADPGGAGSAAWPQCIWKNNGSLSLADAFAHKRQGGCGNAQPNAGLAAAGAVQPSAIVSHGAYLYASTSAGAVVQVKVTKDPVTGLSQYASRTYLTRDFTPITGLGVADDLAALMVYSDPSTIGVGAAEAVTRLPICEDL